MEGILEELEAQGKDLEVVHNVEMSEVKRHLDRWRGAGEKEFYNLLNSKEAFTVKTKEQLPPGTLIVPGKAVATVKPPPSGGTAHFKRKLRFVVCATFSRPTRATFTLLVQTPPRYGCYSRTTRARTKLPLGLQMYTRHLS